MPTHAEPKGRPACAEQISKWVVSNNPLPRYRCPWQGGSDANGGATGNGRPAPSGISLPKGEGAIRGIWWILGYSFGAVSPPEILDVVTLGSTREGWRGKELVR